MSRRNIIFIITIALSIVLIITSLVSMNNINRDLKNRCAELKNELIDKELLLEIAREQNADMEKNANY